jgi:uroporphyrinogen decarboxylase
MNSRERFLKACHCEPLDRPPVWVMRQAGRHLPEYRKLRKTHSFHDVVANPELALEVTMQPLRRYDVDAAIMFSDILVIPEAMGQPYHFPEGGGIRMEFAVDSESDVDRLGTDGIAEHLSHVGDAIRLIRQELDGERALIGFSGSPWTLATYMVEGGSSKSYATTKEMLYGRPDLFERLMDKITASVIEYFEMQIEAGVDAVQIFDSWGGVLAPPVFERASTRWMRTIVDAIDGRVPVIVFSKGMSHLHDALAATGANVIGVSWNTHLDRVHESLPDDIGVQGNLDPVILNTTPDIVEDETRRILERMRGRAGHIFNLGHGISPDAKPENVKRMVDTIVNFD